MALQAPVTPRASMGRSVMMTGPRTCVKMLNPAVNQSALPYGMTRMGLNPAEREKERETRRSEAKRWKGRREKLDREKWEKIRERLSQGESCLSFIQEMCWSHLTPGKLNPTGDCVTSWSLHPLLQAVKIAAIHFSIWVSPWSHWEIKYLMTLALVGNMTLCELVIWRPERPIWVIL